MHLSQKGNIMVIGLLIATLASFFGIGQISQYRDTVNTLSENIDVLQSNLVDQEAEIIDLQNQIDADVEDGSAPTFGAFRPSGYTGKLLTRLSEGGSETTFRTTPNEAPDGTGLSTTKLGDFIVLTINPGADNEEKISASAVATSTGGVATWTIIDRGLSFTENVSLTANKKQHAIGETVIISDDDHFLSTQYPSRDSDETVPGDWTFTGQVTFSTTPISASSSPATATTTGTVELATGGEAASSTLAGDIATSRLAIWTGISTSSAPSSGNVVVVTGDDGNIDRNFIPDTFGSTTMRIFTASTTYSKPDNLKFVIIEVIGAGGNGGDASSGGDANAAGGGGAGGYAKRIIPASLVPSTVAIRVGTANSSASSSFDGFATSTGGINGNTSSGSGNGSDGGAGGTATGGDINLTGQPGFAGFAAGTSNGMAGAGGSTFYGFGGRSDYLTTSLANGNAGTGYGAGGSGGVTSDNASGATGGAGATGAVIVREYF